MLDRTYYPFNILWKYLIFTHKLNSQVSPIVYKIERSWTTFLHNTVYLFYKHHLIASSWRYCKSALCTGVPSSSMNQAKIRLIFLWKIVFISVHVCTLCTVLQSYSRHNFTFRFSREIIVRKSLNIIREMQWSTVNGLTLYSPKVISN